jgi:hypothetical protein
MAVKLIFTNYPFTKDNFLDAIHEEDTLNEFLKLFNIASYEGNVRCKFPTQIEYDKIENKIKSIELKNLLAKYPDKDILIIPDKDDFSSPENIHIINIEVDET